MLLAEKVAKSLIEKKKTLSLAESCTGGLLTHRLTNIPGSSQFLECSIVAYSNASKRKLLKIPLKCIKKYGAVSKETATLMAQNVQKIFKTDFGISITGIAGPGGATKTKPVGLCFIALATAKHTRCLQCHFKGNRLQIKSKAVTEALKLLTILLT